MDKRAFSPFHIILILSPHSTSKSFLCKCKTSTLCNITVDYSQTMRHRQSTGPTRREQVPIDGQEKHKFKSTIRSRRPLLYASSEKSKTYTHFIKGPRVLFTAAAAAALAGCSAGMITAHHLPSFPFPPPLLQTPSSSPFPLLRRPTKPRQDNPGSNK